MSPVLQLTRCVPSVDACLPINAVVLLCRATVVSAASKFTPNIFRFCFWRWRYSPVWDWKKETCRYKVTSTESTARSSPGYWVRCVFRSVTLGSTRFSFGVCLVCVWYVFGLKSLGCRKLKGGYTVVPTSYRQVQCNATKALDNSKKCY